ncbi:MAG: hypothetical protein ACI4V0_01885 [Lachnospiraceae bacterium]
MKKLKKITSLLLTLAMVLSLLSGCTNAASKSSSGTDTTGGKEESSAAVSSESKGDTYKIAVATIMEGETWEAQKSYYENVVGPALNMEFMFSEKLADANGLVDFMERAYAAGCVGLINFVTSNDAISQGARKAEEWGMWFVTQNSALNEEVAELTYNLGHCGASAQGMGTAYANAFDKLLSDGENHSVFIFSGAAVGGASGQGAASHYYSVEGILQAMQDKYDLTYEKSIDEIINNQNPGEVATGNSDIKIYIYPGVDFAAATTAVQTQFQTGDYDIFAAVLSYSAFTNAISDVEGSLGKNIKIIGTASIEAQTATGFETIDSQNDTMLNAAVINPLNNANGICAVILYNALTGHADAMKDNGKAVLFKVEPWDCMSADIYTNIAQLDTLAETYVLNADDLQALCVENDGSITFQTIEAKLEALADVESIIAEKIK